MRRLRYSPSLVLAAALVPVALAGPAARADTRADSSLARLAPTSSPPWNPAQPVPSAERWEHAVRAPGAVAVLPFSLLGMGMKRGLIFVEQNDVVPKVVAQVSVITNYGLIAGPASLGDRTGWGAEAGVNPTFFRNLVASASASTNGYNRAHLSIVAPGGRLVYQSDWRSREPFFGAGPGARREDASNFASQGEFARLELNLPFVRPHARTREILDDPAAATATDPAPRRKLRAWAGPRSMVLLDGRERTAERPPLGTRFPALASAQLGTRVEHFVYGAEATIDARSGRPHWWKGWRATASAERFDVPIEPLALRSASTPSVSFTRLAYQAEGALSFWDDPRTIRLRARLVDQIGRTGSGLALLSDLVTLGGSQGLAGFEPGRFRDADLMVGRATYLFPIARYLETDLHVEAGAVAGRFQDTRLESLETSYGAALRVRSPFAPLAAVGLDWSRETVRFSFSLGGIE